MLLQHVFMCVAKLVGKERENILSYPSASVLLKSMLHICFADIKKLCKINSYEIYFCHFMMRMGSGVIKKDLKNL